MAGIVLRHLYFDMRTAKMYVVENWNFGHRRKKVPYQYKTSEIKQKSCMPEFE